MLVNAPLHSEAKYLTDQAGAFEIVENGADKAMRQVMVRLPVSWCIEQHDAPYPFSVIDNYNWTNVVVTINMSFEYDYGIAMVAARVTNGGCAVAKIGSQGIVLALNNTHNQGVWMVSNSTGLSYHFDSGSIVSPIIPNKWYQLKLNVTNEDITASIDEMAVSHIPLFNSPNSWIAIGSSIEFKIKLHYQFYQ